MFSKELRTQIAEEIISIIGDYEGVYGCDLSHHMYNEDYYIIGTYQAKEFLKKYFDDMIETLERYQNEFGERYQADPEKLATLVALFVAEEVLSESEVLNKYWNNELEAEQLKEIKEEFKNKYGLGE